MHVATPRRSRYHPLGANDRPGAVTEDFLLRQAATRMNQRRMVAAQAVAAATGAPVAVPMVIPVNAAGERVGPGGAENLAVSAPVMVSAPVNAVAPPSSAAPDGGNGTAIASPGDASPVSAPPAGGSTSPTSTATGTGATSSPAPDTPISLLSPADVPIISDAVDPLTGEGETVTEEFSFAGQSGPWWLIAAAIALYMLTRKKRR